MEEDSDNEPKTKGSVKQNGLFEETKSKINDDKNQDNAIQFEGGESSDEAYSEDDDQRRLTEDDQENTQTKLNQEKGFFNVFNDEKEELKIKVRLGLA